MRGEERSPSASRPVQRRRRGGGALGPPRRRDRCPGRVRALERGASVRARSTGGARASERPASGRWRLRGVPPDTGANGAVAPERRMATGAGARSARASEPRPGSRPARRRRRRGRRRPRLPSDRRVEKPSGRSVVLDSAVAAGIACALHRGHTAGSGLPADRVHFGVPPRPMDPSQGGSGQQEERSYT